MKRHFQYWGAMYILLALFAGSLAGHFYYQVIVEEESLAAFGASVFENWQSEWLQLLTQGVLLLALGHKFFRADKHDIEEIKTDLQDIKDLLDGR